MNICIIGNSHVAALKLGWDQMRRDHPDASITFLAAPATEMEALFLDGKLLKAGTPSLERYLLLSSGSEAIEPGAFDAVVLHGMAFSNRFARMVYNRYRLVEQAQTQKSFLISRESFIDAICGLLHGSMCWRIREIVIAAGGGAPIILCQPHPGERIVETDARWKIPTQDLESLAALFQDALNKIRKEGAAVLDQPSQTVTNHIFSKSTYAAAVESFSAAFGGEENAVRAERKKIETSHVNGEFGTVFLRHLLSHIASIGP
jgi:hypothetical protein